MTHGTASKLTIPVTVGATTSGEFTLALTQTTTRLTSGTCPTTLSGTATAYEYVELDNPSASTVKVSVWSSKSSNAGAPVIDTVMTSYAGTTLPPTDAARKACVNRVDDDCSATDYATECLNNWAGLVGSDAITIAPNGKVLVYVAAYYNSASNPSAGDFKLTAHADTVTP